MELQFKNGSGTVSVADKIFAADFNEALVHQVVTSFLAGSRSGTKAQKTRSEVSGGGAKPWKQKGTGRARAGSIRSPIWRKGGVTFAAKPRDFEKKVNRKMYRAAICSILSELHRQERLSVVDAFVLNETKTKEFLAKLNAMNVGQDVLLILANVEPSVYLSARNITKVTVIDVKAIDPALLLRHEHVVVDKASLEAMNEWLS
ncbi:50S ribosomal protein L4 [Suttonella indologenes]|uniref:Large ribosomal subunit protein uL4 n=1 Tax=Suttonella indologenes TaxID=13276 RepID=A0A380MV10_9GAMM|nr:50S ribosomal protein L4 [Suttonella indologenes]SUO96112.1 50S ribosomal protein L4 [Suttonella indologenes]